MYMYIWRLSIPENVAKGIKKESTEAMIILVPEGKQVIVSDIVESMMIYTFRTLGRSMVRYGQINLVITHPKANKVSDEEKSQLDTLTEEIKKAFAARFPSFTQEKFAEPVQ